MKAHLLLWLSVCFLLFVGTLTFTPLDGAQERIRAELQAAEAVFGREAALSIAKDAYAAHHLLVVDSGIQGLIEDGYMTEHNPRGQPSVVMPQPRLGSIFNTFLYTLSTQIYGYCLRILVLLRWVCYLAGFFVAVVADGISRRRVRIDTAQPTEPTIYAASQHLVVMCFFAPVVYLLLPFHLTPWFIPVWAMVVALPLSSWLSHAVWLK